MLPRLGAAAERSAALLGQASPRERAVDGVAWSYHQDWY
jgi:hypothetical protein